MVFGFGEPAVTEMAQVPRIPIDINRTTPEGHTPAVYAGAAALTPGDPVIVFEAEDGVCADAVVISVNQDNHSIVLDVDWDSMRDDALGDQKSEAPVDRDS